MLTGGYGCIKGVCLSDGWILIIQHWCKRAASERSPHSVSEGLSLSLTSYRLEREKSTKQQTTTRNLSFKCLNAAG